MVEPTQQAPSLTALILGSAAVGALVSSVITILGQFFDRIAKKKELIFTKAIEMAHDSIELIQANPQNPDGTTTIRPPIIIMRRYHRELTMLYEKGELSPRLETKFKTDIFGPESEDK